MSAVAANNDLVAKKLADFMSNQKRGKKRDRKTAAAAEQDIVGSAANGQPETKAAMLSDHHFSKIDETRIVLGIDKRKNKSAKAATKATADDKIVSFIRNAQGAQTLLKMEIAPFVIGVTSLLNNEGTYGKVKEKKEYENARGDCYFLAIMWAGHLEGRAVDPKLTEEQQECLKKIYRVSRQIMRLMFDEAPWAKFRSQAIDWARTDLKMDYIEASPKYRGNNRAALSETDWEEIEKANPALLDKMLLHAREEFFLKKANQFPGLPSEQEVAAGAKCAQMFSMRQKCYYIQEGKYNEALDKGKKFDPLPGVICTEKTWPEIYRVMAGTGPKDGRRVYNPIEYFNGTNDGAPMARPMKTILVDDVDEEGREIKRQVKIPDATWNPMMEKPETSYANGKIIGQKMVKITSLVATVVKFEPYAGPEQWGVRVVMNGTMSHMDHVHWTPDIVQRQDNWVRSYNYDDVVEVEVPKSAAEVAVEAKEKADKAKAVASAAQNGATEESGGSYESDDSDDDDDKSAYQLAQQNVAVRVTPKTHTPAVLPSSKAAASRVDDDDDDPVLTAAKAKLASASVAAATARASAPVVLSAPEEAAVPTDGKKRKKNKHQQTRVVETPSNDAAAAADVEHQQQKAKKVKTTATNAIAQEAPVVAVAAEPVTPVTVHTAPTVPPPRISKLKKRSKRDEDSGDEMPVKAATVVAAAPLVLSVVPIATPTTTNTNGRRGESEDGSGNESADDHDDDDDDDDDDEESSEDPPPPPPPAKKVKTRAPRVERPGEYVSRTSLSND